jgi:hypothetical protein
MTFPAPDRLSRKTDEEEDRMGRIVVSEFVSLDGVMQAPGGGDEFE